MTKKQRITNQKKKMIIIISAATLLLLLISAILTVTVLNFQNKNKELSNKKWNILYYDENENEEEEGEDNILVVNIDDSNQITNEVNTTNETNTMNSEVTVVDIPYYIKINTQANVVTVYKKDSNGEYTVPYKAMICSVGTVTPTSGVYKISDKYTWRYLQGNVYGQYACRITGHILFHSVPYEKQDKSTLEWWEYDKLGTNASLGCIRLTVADAKWIYDNCASGTQVEFYSSSNPGPLGKPTARKISDDEEVRNWDPTDPDSNNPWKAYLAQQEKETEETSTTPVEENIVENNTVENTSTSENEVTNSSNSANDTNTNIQNTTANTANTVTNTVENETVTSNITTNVVSTNTVTNNIVNEV